MVGVTVTMTTEVGGPAAAFPGWDDGADAAGGGEDGVVAAGADATAYRDVPDAVMA